MKFQAGDFVFVKSINTEAVITTYDAASGICVIRGTKINFNKLMYIDELVKIEVSENYKLYCKAFCEGSLLK